MSVEIKVGSNIYGGWKSYRVERGIEQISGTYELSVSDRWPGQDNPRPIRRGELSEILVDGETIITGYVDDASPAYTDQSHDFRVAGRDATGDLVDCSAIHKTGQWANVTLDKVVRDICVPFKIKVKLDTNVGKAFDSFAIQEGETAFECIDRACRMKAVLPVSDGKGGLVLTRAKDGAPVAELVEGVNILSARGDFGMKERYSLYIVKGQDHGSDDNSDSPETHSQVRAEAKDSFVTRYRPLIVLAESHGPHATYKDRAEWERNVRRGRSSRATVTVQGFRNATGALWQPNTIVRLRSPMLSVDNDLLIVSVAFILDEEGGSRTELQLAGREAFDLIAGVKGTNLKNAIKGKNGAAQGTSDGTKKKSADMDWGT